MTDTEILGLGIEQLHIAINALEKADATFKEIGIELIVDSIELPSSISKVTKIQLFKGMKKLERVTGCTMHPAVDWTGEQSDREMNIELGDITFIQLGKAKTIESYSFD